ncbi:hypothetical protein ACSQ67_025475 [Phaseolus vulgaris]
MPWRRREGNVAMPWRRKEARTGMSVKEVGGVVDPLRECVSGGGSLDARLLMFKTNNLGLRVMPKHFLAFNASFKGPFWSDLCVRCKANFNQLQMDCWPMHGALNGALVVMPKLGWERVVGWCF